MKHIFYIIATALFLGITTQTKAKSNETGKIYLFGFAASFNDSTVYFTEIQEVSGARINAKTKFLTGRSSYSYQLQDYLKRKGVKHPTCVTSYGLDRRKLEKKYAKFKKKYTEKGKKPYDVRILSMADFQYTRTDDGEAPESDK